MSEAPASIRFFFDYISSNAYLAWVRLPEIATRYGMALEPVAVLFAGLLEAHGQLGPAEVPPKARWMLRNNLRKATQLGVPLNPPRFHPFNPLLPLRVSSLPLPEAARRALIDAIFQACWVRGLHPSDPDVVRDLADEIGLPGAELVAEAGRPESKAHLRRQTDEALAAGVFGVSTMMVGTELFWGYDDLVYLELFLAGQDPLPHEATRAWMRAPRPSAVRRRFRPDPGA